MVFANSIKSVKVNIGITRCIEYSFDFKLILNIMPLLKKIDEHANVFSSC